MNTRTLTSRPLSASRRVTRLDWLNPEIVDRVSEAVRTRSSYRDEGGAVERVQTHISSVLLTPRYVFKFKRPVDVGFADFRRLSQRHRFCKAEVRLNRRLAEGVYLDVLPLWMDGDRFSLDGGERIVDYCVVMKRLPRGDMLDDRLRTGNVSGDELKRLAALLVQFHARSSRKRDLARFGSLTVVRRNWEENFQQTEPYQGRSISPSDFQAIRTAVRDYLHRNESLFHARVEEGRIRDGHGDLRAEHVYLGPAGIRIIDCIEFNERFRFGDVANDLAFLLMDLTALGRPDLSAALLENYLALTADHGLSRLVPFYACYRAYVRGKVTSFKLDDRGQSDAQVEAVRQKAQAFFRLSLAFARQMAPRLLVLVSGLMGTGKSALAQALAGSSGMTVHNSDVLRKMLAGEEGASGREAGYDAGIYTPAWNERTYAALFERGQADLLAGRSVILDASFSKRNLRQRARELGEALGARVVIVECRLSEEETLARLRQRERAGGAVSDGRIGIYPAQRAAFEPITEFGSEHHIVVDTQVPPAELVKRLLQDPRLSVPPPLFALSG